MTAKKQYRRLSARAQRLLSEEIRDRYEMKDIGGVPHVDYVEGWSDAVLIDVVNERLKEEFGEEPCCTKSNVGHWRLSAYGPVSSGARLASRAARSLTDQMEALNEAVADLTIRIEAMEDAMTAHTHTRSV